MGGHVGHGFRGGGKWGQRRGNGHREARTRLSLASRASARRATPPTPSEGPDSRSGLPLFREVTWKVEWDARKTCVGEDAMVRFTYPHELPRSRP
ncbi:hypothetical protein D187_010504 [Cystobacter fuscus DSM 2262]|uniref:Uncharacterized protein n=1 Tax=Cystobacter fuscus (strain ATCC 25194 / DSM 2262 / NBRC 100088 / M29) TaxID=1242864 RepID=S9PBV8_CYSF2|nr:hypothetical protein D187_010504 [Cystobacter fuscus DSM 2262]